jgi:hypothetical protein
MMPWHPLVVPQLQKPGVLCLTSIQGTWQNVGRQGLVELLPGGS